jgi:hypothetical protein
VCGVSVRALACVRACVCVCGWVERVFSAIVFLFDLPPFPFFVLCLFSVGSLSAFCLLFPFISSFICSSSIWYVFVAYFFCSLDQQSGLGRSSPSIIQGWCEYAYYGGTTHLWYGLVFIFLVHPLCSHSHKKSRAPLLTCIHLPSPLHSLVHPCAQNSGCNRVDA